MGIQQRLLIGLFAALILIALVARTSRDAQPCERCCPASRTPQTRDPARGKGTDGASQSAAATSSRAPAEMPVQPNGPTSCSTGWRSSSPSDAWLREAVSPLRRRARRRHVDTDQLLRAIVETAVRGDRRDGRGCWTRRRRRSRRGRHAGTGADQPELPLRAEQEAGVRDALPLRAVTRRGVAPDDAASLVGQVAIALDNAKLHRIVERQALVDGTTGLANRRQAEDTLAAELSRALLLRWVRRPSRDPGDLDDSKPRLNDAHGALGASGTPCSVSSRTCLGAHRPATSTSPPAGAARSSLPVAPDRRRRGRPARPAGPRLPRGPDAAGPPRESRSGSRPASGRQAQGESEAGRARGGRRLGAPTRPKRRGKSRVASGRGEPSSIRVICANLPAPGFVRLHRGLTNRPRLSPVPEPGETMPVETPRRCTAQVIQEHLELSSDRKLTAFENQMPIEPVHGPGSPFENHPLFKTEEQARLEEHHGGHREVPRGRRGRQPAPAGPARTPPSARRPRTVSWSRSRDFDWGRLNGQSAYAFPPTPPGQTLGFTTIERG